MIEGNDPVLQAFLGTLMTWGLTALGAAMAFFIRGNQRKLLDASLGFAGGVMLAASYWSLLEPAIEMAEKSGTYGLEGEYAFAPVAVGFFTGALFVFGADVLMSYAGVNSPYDLDEPLENVIRQRKRKNLSRGRRQKRGTADSSAEQGVAESEMVPESSEDEGKETASEYAKDTEALKEEHNARWKRILLLIVAVTVHNIPEGLAVGVAFGSVNKVEAATFEKARNLAIGIGIQNFPEGLAVSLPLKTAGFSAAKSIWYGQLSGLVEPIAGVLGALLVGIMNPILPYALAFAAGAMVYVVIDDIIPEAQTCGNGKLASWSCIVGFLVMMSLDLLPM